MLVARLSFSGERAYEVYCGADHLVTVWERLLEAGTEFDVVPYGLEALGTLRIEKGHVTGMPRSMAAPPSMTSGSRRCFR